MIQDVAYEFDLRSKKLLENHRDDPILHDKIEKFLHGLEYGVTGYHNFAFVSSSRIIFNVTTTNAL